MKVSFFGASARRFRGDLLFDRTRFEILLVNIDHFGNVGLLGNKNIGWCRATPKLTNISAVIFFDLFGAGGLFS